MVEFCKKCSVSLPTGDVTIKGGKIFTSMDYVCPECGELANPNKDDKRYMEPTDEKDVTIKNGRSSLE